MGQKAASCSHGADGQIVAKSNTERHQLTINLLLAENERQIRALRSDNEVAPEAEHAEQNDDEVRAALEEYFGGALTRSS